MRLSSAALARGKPETGERPLVVKTKRVSPSFGSAVVISAASGDKCTSCARSFFAFLRGIVHRLFSRSISDYSSVPTS